MLLPWELRYINIIFNFYKKKKKTQEGTVLTCSERFPALHDAIDVFPSVHLVQGFLI